MADERASEAVATQLDAGQHVRANVADLPPATVGQKACEMCTALNEDTNRECEVCGTPFPNYYDF